MSTETHSVDPKTLPEPIVDWQPARRTTSAALFGAALLGAVAMGALAIGAVAIGRLEVGHLVVKRRSDPV
jgi:hypothetical protein